MPASFVHCLLCLLLFLGGIARSQPPRIKVACVGNSVTFGAGLQNPETSSYPAVLQQLLGARYDVRNFGHSGATLLRKGHNPYANTRAFAEALTFTPDVVLIHLGLNDTDPRNWPAYRDEFAADYSWLIDTFRKQNAGVTVYISRLTPIFHDHKRFRSGTRDWFWQIQELIPRIAAANKVGLLDFHTPLYAHPELFPDALHPDEKGAAVLAKTVYQKITGDYGALQLPDVFASHMVLQRREPVSFYGSANRGESIQVRFNGHTRTAVGGEDGRWKVDLPPMEAGGPYTASVTSPARTIVLEDILVGEVWLCSGQSNMDFPLKAAVQPPGEGLRAQRSSSVRLLNREPIAETDNRPWDAATLDKVNRLQYFSGRWQRCDSVTASTFSAVAYYFAQELHRRLKVPIGIIQVAVGGSPAESWVDRYTLEHHPVLVNELYDWRQSDYFMPWVRQRADTNLKLSKVSRQRHPFEPAYNFEAGIAPLSRFPVRGVLWYQGESNAHNVELHEVVFPELVKSWRRQWGYSFPFYYVQLSSLDRPTWAHFRYSQLQLLQKISRSGMVVSSDVGDAADVHPRRKSEVGRRLARLALYDTYGFKDLIPYGPLPLKATRQEDTLLVSFRYTGKKLATADSQELRGFTMVNEKGITTEAKAFVRARQVKIPVRRGERIREVRYGWQPYTDANLVNEAGLPASTFKLEIQ
jgi:sialate O-acetylesterase